MMIAGNDKPGFKIDLHIKNINCTPFVRILSNKWGVCYVKRCTKFLKSGALKLAVNMAQPTGPEDRWAACFALIVFVIIQ